MRRRRQDQRFVLEELAGKLGYIAHNLPEIVGKCRRSVDRIGGTIRIERSSLGTEAGNIHRARTLGTARRLMLINRAISPVNSA